MITSFSASNFVKTLLVENRRQRLVQLGGRRSCELAIVVIRDTKVRLVSHAEHLRYRTLALRRVSESSATFWKPSPGLVAQSSMLMELIIRHASDHSLADLNGELCVGLRSKAIEAAAPGERAAHGARRASRTFCVRQSSISTSETFRTPPLAQAFQSLVRPLLGQSEAEVGRWRGALSEALGPNRSAHREPGCRVGARDLKAAAGRRHATAGRAEPLPDGFPALPRSNVPDPNPSPTIRAAHITAANRRISWIAVIF